MDYASYYSLERYLFDVVHSRFDEDHSLGAFDFFSIVIWKANRAKSKIAKKLLENDTECRVELEPICRSLTLDLHKIEDSRDCLHNLIGVWGFRLPMASAILTVLWPEKFSVYDVRVCDELNGHHRLSHLVSFESIWRGYQDYLNDVRMAAPEHLSLRDQDRYLWGRSAAIQLEDNLRNGFGFGDSKL